MQHSAILRRLVLATVVVGAASTAGPAMASAASSCTYNTFNHNVIVTDNSGPQQMQLVRVGDEIRVADGFGARVACAIPGTGTNATVNNTEKIAVFATRANAEKGYAIDQVNGAFAPGLTKETDGTSELEITFDTTGEAVRLEVFGNKDKNVMSVTTGGKVNFGYDLDPDVIPSTPFVNLILHGGLGNDELDARGGSMLPAAEDMPVWLQGEGGDDILADGDAIDILDGGSGNDFLFSGKRGPDHVYGGVGVDNALTNLDDDVKPDVEVQKIER